MSAPLMATAPGIPSEYRRKSLKDVLFNQNHANKTETSDIYQRLVHLMDDRCVTIEFTTQTLGGALLREVCRYLNVTDSMNYFGIRFVDNSNLMEWLQLDKRAYKQLKDLKNDMLSLRIAFYPPKPLEAFKDPTSRHLFYMQLRRDFYIGRLRTNSLSTYELAAWAIQADHGLTSIPEGFDIINVPGGMRILPDIPKEVVHHIRCRLKPLLGMSKEEAVNGFIEKACTVETYGMEPFQVTDQFDNGLCIGFNYVGISAFKNGERTDVFHWRNIREVNRSGKQLVIVVPRGQCDVRLGFKARSTAEAKMLWHRAVTCRNFAKQITQKKYSSSEVNLDDDLSGSHPELQSPSAVESHSESDSSSEMLQQMHQTAKPRIEQNRSTTFLAKKPAAPSLLPVPRLSMVEPPSKGFCSADNSPLVNRKHHSGGPELRNLTRLDLLPVVCATNQNNAGHITRSSINLNKEDNANNSHTEN